MEQKFGVLYFTKMKPSFKKLSASARKTLDELTLQSMKDIKKFDRNNNLKVKIIGSYDIKPKQENVFIVEITGNNVLRKLKRRDDILKNRYRDIAKHKTVKRIVAKKVM